MGMVCSESRCEAGELDLYHSLNLKQQRDRFEVTVKTSQTTTPVSKRNVMLEPGSACRGDQDSPMQQERTRFDVL